MEQKNFKRTTVTAALPYANGGVHIGHLAGVYVPADIYVRYLRLKKQDVVFIGGSDEHGVPVTIRAKKEGITVQEVVDRYHNLIKKSFEDFGISFDIYSRTTSPTHNKFASDFFRTLYDKGVLEEKVEEQFCDEVTGEFLTDRNIVGTCPRCGAEGAYGDQCEKCGATLSPGGTDYLSEAKSITDENIEKKIDWVAFKNQFFSAVMIAKNNFAENSLMTSVPQEKGSGNLKQYEAKMKTFFDPSGKTPSEFDFYFGPNDFRLLKRVEAESTFGKDLEMQRLVYLGWPLFRIINRWFTIYVFDFLTGLNINMGIVLILITMLLKFITYPMVKKSYMSSAKMRVLKPKLEEATKHLNKPEDQMQKQQAMMMEYSKYGVSPMAGCLPMLIQMPIWIAMFNFVPNAIQLRGESFLWINDLSTYDPIIEWNTNLWLIGDHLSLTCILFCVANILYSWMTMRQQRDQMVGQQAEQMKMMQWMMFLMPVMFFFMFND